MQEPSAPCSVGWSKFGAPVEYYLVGSMVIAKQVYYFAKATSMRYYRVDLAVRAQAVPQKAQEARPLGEQSVGMVLGLAILGVVLGCLRFPSVFLK